MQSRELNLNPEKRIIGLDAGSVRTGVSMADSTCTLASPYNIIHTMPKNSFAQRLNELLDGYEVSMAVVGLPLDLRGREGESAQLAREIGELIETQLGWQVRFLDERFSTMAAGEPNAKKDKRSRKPTKPDPMIDAKAAAVILQDWLDHWKDRE